MTDGLELRNLACSRGGRRLFAGLSRCVPRGQALRVVGPNGSGKTSLLRTVCGLLAASRGEVLWRGHVLADLPDGLGGELLYIGHAASLKSELSALDNLRSACELAGTPVSAAQATAALERAGLKGQHGVAVGRLSQGQRRRAALARLALPLRLPLWVLDEPFTALDSDAVAWVEELLRTHTRRAGTVVFTCHQHPAIAGLTEQELVL